MVHVDGQITVLLALRERPDIEREREKGRGGRGENVVGGRELKSERDFAPYSRIFVLYVCRDFFKDSLIWCTYEL